MALLLRRFLYGRVPHHRRSAHRSILWALTARLTSADLATLIATADTDEVVRLRLLRAIRDLSTS